MKERFEQWLQILVFALVMLRIESIIFGVNITYVESAVKNGAVCLDGSPPAYYFAPGHGRGINNWLIHIEGGAWCNNVTDCLSRKETALGSSKLMPKAREFVGSLSGHQKLNPYFYNWNRVFVGYCDGASFTGDVEAVNPDTKLYYRGERVFDAVMEDLFHRGMNLSRNAILSGCSAGGLTTILHCDKFRGLFHGDTKVKCHSDAGYFINAKDILGRPTIQQFYNEVVETHGSAKNLPQWCTSKMSPGLCFFPQYVAQGIQTPIFFTNPAYDAWQIACILVPLSADPKNLWLECKFDIRKCSNTQLQIIQDFRIEFLKALLELGYSSSTGYFIDSCHTHCQSDTQFSWNVAPRLHGKTIAEAVGEWFYDDSEFQNIDCPYPCNKSCPQLSGEHSSI